MSIKKKKRKFFFLVENRNLRAEGRSATSSAQDEPPVAKIEIKGYKQKMARKNKITNLWILLSSAKKSDNDIF